MLSLLFLGTVVEVFKEKFREQRITVIVKKWQFFEKKGHKLSIWHLMPDFGDHYFGRHILGIWVPIKDSVGQSSTPWSGAYKKSPGL